MDFEITQQLVKRFWKKVHKNLDTNCWEWTAHLDKDGYGGVWIGEIGKQSERAHRLSWFIHFGKIENGLYVCHKCDNRKCVNPSHLFLGNAKDNFIDSRNKGRNLKTLQPRPRLVSDTDELKIVELCRVGKTHDEISEIIGVSRSIISKYARRQGILRNFSKEQVADFVKWHDSGMSYAHISRKVNREQSAIRKAIKKFREGFYEVQTTNSRRSSRSDATSGLSTPS